MPKKDIMIIDDSRLTRENVAKFLKGYNVTEASSGEEGFQILKDKKPDLILLDIMLPGMDGFETAIRIKETPGLKNIPIIFVSGRTDRETKAAALVVGEHFIEKPVDENMIKKVVKSTLE